MIGLSVRIAVEVVVGQDADHEGRVFELVVEADFDGPETIPSAEIVTIDRVADELSEHLTILVIKDKEVGRRGGIIEIIASAAADADVEPGKGSNRCRL